MRRSGFTFIEAVVIVGILGIMAYLSVPMYNSYRIRSDHRLAASHTQQGINRARLLAQNREQNANWGFYIPNGTMYKGTSYPSRDPNFDETYPMPSSIAVAGIYDVSFDADGTPSQIGDVVLTALTDDEAVIPIRFNVAVNTLVTEATDSLVICDNGVTRTIVEAAWPSYQAGGAVLNACSGGGSSIGGTSSGGASSSGGTSSGGASSSGGTSSGGASSGGSSAGTSSSAGSSVGTSSSITPPPASSSAGTSSSVASSVGTSSSVASSSSSSSSSTSSMVSLTACAINYYPSTQVIDPTETMEVAITSYVARVNFGTQSNPPLTSGNGPQVLVHYCYGESPTQVPSGTSFWSAVWGGNGICKNTSNGNSTGNAVAYSSSSGPQVIEIDSDKFFTLKVVGRYKNGGFLAFNQFPDTTRANTAAIGKVRYLRQGDSLPSTECQSGSCSVLASYLNSIGKWNGSTKQVSGLGTCDMLAVTEFESLSTASNLADYDDGVALLTFGPEN